MLSFFEKYDALIIPAAQVVPFDNRNEWVEKIGDVEMKTYIEWMSICCVITVTGFPSISIPGGFTPGGLPVGIQIVGKPRGDLDLLKIARFFEFNTNYYKKRLSIF